MRKRKGGCREEGEATRKKSASSEGPGLRRAAALRGAELSGRRKRRGANGSMGKRSGRAPANERGPRGRGRGLWRVPGGAEERGALQAVVKGGQCWLPTAGLGIFVCLFCFSLKLCPLFSVDLSCTSAYWEPRKEARV